MSRAPASRPPEARDVAERDAAERDVAELELKFVLDAAALARLQAAGFASETASVARLRSVYWDTPDGDLLAARVALRVRRTPDGWVQTVKGEGKSAFDRFEWEAPVQSETPERAALPPAGLSVGAAVHRHFDRVVPLFATEFERTAWMVRPTSSLSIELAADLGEIQAGDHSRPIAELEAERHGGADVAFYRWAQRFAERHDLRLTYATKNERGLRLAGRLPAQPPAVRAQPAAIEADRTAGVAAAQAVHDCIAHFTANVEPLRAGDDPAAVHQARIALRRLRAALRFFDLPRREPGWKKVDAIASRLAAALGRLRDADVFADGTLEAMRAALPAEPAIAALDEALAQWRERERTAVRAAAAGRDATRMVLTSLYLSERLKRTVRAVQGDDLRAIGFGEFAAQRVARLATKLAERAEQAAARDDAAADAGWHRVRIAAKNLRYGLEFAAGALPKRKRARAALARLVRLQQRLGVLQDQAAASAAAARVLEHHADGLGAARAVALVDGWLAHARGRTGRSERAKAQRAVERIRHALRGLPDAAPA